ncbi:hypothetical protein QUW15_02695 [Desulfovibrio piger]|nr:hypothetical protein [Desulfovibrio piger]
MPDTLPRRQNGRDPLPRQRVMRVVLFSGVGIAGRAGERRP